ncbi:MAG: MraY family glycosyltransferase [Candidatus Omnitrophota bacterium]
MKGPGILEALFFFCLSFLLSFVVSRFLLKYADRLKLGKKVFKERVKLHAKQIPRIGGIALFVSFWLSVASVWLFSKESLSLSGPKLIGMGVGSSVVMLAGLFDDIVRRLGYRIKFVLQSTGVLIAILAGYSITGVTSFSTGYINVGIFGIPLMLIWMLMIINAINLIDGLDGLACGICAIVCIGFAVIGFSGNREGLMIMSVILAGSCLAFLRYNFHPAKLFLGDSGSLFLGFLLGILSAESSIKRSAVISLIVPFLTLFIPMASVCFTFTRRIAVARNPFSPDRWHLHYRLLRAGVSHRDAVLLYYTVTALYVLLGCLAVRFPVEYETPLALVGIAAILFLYLWALRFISLRARSMRTEKRKKHTK